MILIYLRERLNIVMDKDISNLSIRKEEDMDKDDTYLSKRKAKTNDDDIDLRVRQKRC